MFVSKQQYAVLFFLSFCSRNKVFSPFSLTLDRHCQFDATCLYIVLDLFFARCRTQVITVSALLNSPPWNWHFPRTIKALPSASSNYINVASQLDKTGVFYLNTLFQKPGLMMWFICKLSPVVLTVIPFRHPQAFLLGYFVMLGLWMRRSKQFGRRRSNVNTSSI